MPKLQNVTAEELAALTDSTMEVMGTMQNVVKRIEAGYADPIPEPCQLASTFHALARTMSGITAIFIMKAKLNEIRANTEARIREQLGKKG